MRTELSPSAQTDDGDRVPRAISLVVATLNRAEALAEMLRSLSACSHPDGVIVELVLVDNGSTDHTAKVVGDFKPASWLSIRKRSMLRRIVRRFSTTWVKPMNASSL